MSDTSDDDRRIQTRGPIELKVEYKRLNAFFADYTKNISKDGTFIKTSKPLGIGTEFVFQLHIPSIEQPIRLNGEVKWIITEEDLASKPPRVRAELEAGMGIRFIYRDDSEGRRLHQLVEQLMTESLGPIVYSRLMEQSRLSEDDDDSDD